MSEQQTSHRSHKDVLLGIFEAMNKGDFTEWDAGVTEDLVVEYPQSGERFVGSETNKQMLQHYPGHLNIDTSAASMYVTGDEGHYLMTPMFTTVKVEGEGDTLVASVKARYPDGSDWWVIDIAHFRGDRVDHRYMFFAPCFDAPEWRRKYAE